VSRDAICGVAGVLVVLDVVDLLATDVVTFDPPDQFGRLAGEHGADDQLDVALLDFVVLVL
jgi:hypothetical protein